MATGSKLTTRVSRDKPGRVTRRQVAEAAGVSLTTVTHALNDTPGTRISRNVRDRVKRVARHLGYRPSYVGQALVSGQTRTIGLVQPQPQSMHSRLYQLIIYGLAEAMQADDHDLLVMFRNRPDHCLEVINEGRVDGMLVIQSDHDFRHIDAIVDTGIPTVVINTSYPLERAAHVGRVRSDNEAVMTTILDSFRRHGCRAILNLNDGAGCDTNETLMRSFRTGMAPLAIEGAYSSHFSRLPPGPLDELANALAAGQRWDAIYLDGLELLPELDAMLRRFGLHPQRDYQLAVTHTHQVSPPPKEGDLYIQQPAKLGEEAWKLLRQLLAGSAENHDLLVPYVRQTEAGLDAAG